MRYAVAVMIVVAGCGPAGPPPTAPDPGTGVGLSTSGLVERTPDTCGLAAFESLVGQPAGAVDSVVTDQPVRLVAPGSIVTTEYNPQRVNVDVNASNVITGVRCG